VTSWKARPRNCRGPSHHVGFALAPAGPTVRLRHIDFVNLEGRVLVVMVATGGQITHKVVDPPAPCDDGH
jgi:transcriptional regulator of heat shock response